MQDRKPPFDSPIVKWTIFLLVLIIAMVWEVRGVLERAERMQTANTSASMFARTAPGSPAKAVIRLDQVVGTHLNGTLLERESDTAYRVPIEMGPPVAAVLTPETSVVMGRPQDIAPGAVVQLAGTLDKNRVLRANQVVILTGYVRLLESER
jgi:hypothetical protein